MNKLLKIRLKKITRVTKSTYCSVLNVRKIHFKFALKLCKFKPLLFAFKRILLIILATLFGKHIKMEHIRLHTSI